MSRPPITKVIIDVGDDPDHVCTECGVLVGVGDVKEYGECECTCSHDDVKITVAFD